jgi:hypothetical protein
MNRGGEPSRLIEETSPGSALGRGLEAARGRGPSDEQLRALERGVFASIGAGIVAGTVASGRPGGPPVRSAGLSLSAVKLIVLLAVGSLGATAGALATRWLRGVAPTAAVPRRLESTGARPLALGPVVVPLPELDRGVSPPRDPAPTPSAPHFAPAPQDRVADGEPHASPNPPPPVPQREDELPLLERAESALASDPAAALSLAEEHERRFPRASLREEREVIVVSALASLGRYREARARANDFGRAHAGSAYALRLRRALARPPSSQADNSSPSRPFRGGGSNEDK